MSSCNNTVQQPGRAFAGEVCGNATACANQVMAYSCNPHGESLLQLYANTVCANQPSATGCVKNGSTIARFNYLCKWSASNAPDFCEKKPQFAMKPPVFGLIASYFAFKITVNCGGCRHRAPRTTRVKLHEIHAPGTVPCNRVPCVHVPCSMFLRWPIHAAPKCCAPFRYLEAEDITKMSCVKDACPLFKYAWSVALEFAALFLLL